MPCGFQRSVSPAPRSQKISVGKQKNKQATNPTTSPTRMRSTPTHRMAGAHEATGHRAPPRLGGRSMTGLERFLDCVWVPPAPMAALHLPRSGRLCF